jgi:hypothetical protein
MTGVLRVADVDRWDPESLRQIAGASRLRAEAAESAAEGLTYLPVFGPADGPRAASPEAIAQTGAQLSAHAWEAREVATAADIAADGVEDLKNRLAALRARASGHQLRIDENSDSVIPESPPSIDHPGSELTVAGLQGELDALVVEANRLDRVLARAIEGAGHSRTCTEPPGAEAS